MVAQDALGLIRQDVSGRQNELLIDIFELLRFLLTRTTNEHSQSQVAPLSVIFLPVFFNLSSVDIMKWRQIAARLNELIIEAPKKLPRKNKQQSDAIANQVAAPNRNSLNPIFRTMENRQNFNRPLRRPLAGRLHPAILRLRA